MQRYDINNTGTGTVEENYSSYPPPKKTTIHDNPHNSYPPTTSSKYVYGREYYYYETIPFVAVMGMSTRDDDERTKDVNEIPTTPLIFAVLIASMSQFLSGYNTGVMNAPESVVFVGHTTAQWSLAVAAFAVGGPFGATLAAGLADNRGRRGAFMINSLLFLLGGLVQSLAINMNVVILARFIIGLASGISSVLVALYVGELAPPTLRGTLGTLPQFAMVVGILLSDLFAFPFATESKWRLLFSVTAVTAFLQLLCSPWLLESPLWLLNRDPKSQEAREILKKIRVTDEVDTELNKYKHGIDAQSSEIIGFADMFKNENVKLPLVGAIVLQMIQQLCGINAVFYYSTAIFKGVISNPKVGTTVIGAVNVAATYYASTLLVDSHGVKSLLEKCKSLLLWSSGGMFLSCIILVAALLGEIPNMFALVAVIFYVVFFAIGLGPIPNIFITGEVFNAKYVALVMSASQMVNWVCNFLVGLIFPYMNNYLGAYSFMPFAAVLFFGGLFIHIWLPETPASDQDAENQK